MGHISGTWELLLCEYWRRSMIIIEKNTDLKRLTGRLKLRFLTEIGRLHWNQGEEVAHFAWFGEPWFNTNKTKNKYKDICKSERWYANKNKELNNYWIYQSFRKLKTLAWSGKQKNFPDRKIWQKFRTVFVLHYATYMYYSTICSCLLFSKPFSFGRERVIVTEFIV
jgi:hypothetical protein